MILCVERTKANRERKEPTNHELAQMAAERFHVLSGKLPKPRRLLDGSNDGVGVFLATAAAIAGWNHFRRRPGPERQHVY